MATGGNGETLDAATAAIERDNPSLKGVPPKECARPGLDKQRLGQVSDLSDQHPDLKADYVLANPPFNDSDWRGDKDNP